MVEHHFICPYCWEEVSVLIDHSVAEQSYIEDCEVCCNPINITIRFQNFRLTDFRVDRIGQ
ncbi:CPXCG motif-containing cysteine-rich protein [Aestuariivivens sediminis]|uniref:CPXCG motif-containing cysteine-rich protein n=1 Tax=Aestuariivivens sediminis TaxID=2913557 RepID=UPI001F59AD33|nr:CPXCG motif-containing cysteine-rich protein [Aestuariivivens sediminis]